MRKILAKISNDKKGSYTIEAIFILSTLLVIVFLLCFSFMLMYHRVLLNKTASLLAQQAAKEWHYGEELYHHVTELAHGSKTIVQTVEGDLTAEIVQMSAVTNPPKGVTQKCKAVQKAVLMQLAKTIKKPESTTVEVRYNSGLITQEITVCIRQEMAVPFGQLKRFFSGQDTILLSVEEKVIVTEPAEFIRNVDLLLECKERIGDKVNLNELLGKFKGKN